jgi:drug/metabolite transporter (DMT)-like permease
MTKLVIDKLSIDTWPLLTLKFSVLVVVGIAMWVFNFKAIKTLLLKKSTHDVKTILFYTILAGIGLAGGDVFLTLAYANTGRPAIVTTIAYCTPLITLFLFTVFLHEVVSFRAFIGVLLTVAGLIMISV